MAKRNTVSWCAVKRRICDPASPVCRQCEKRGFRPKRESPSARGYGGTWRKIREEVLQGSGIPRHLWPEYDVDHNPPYNPEIEPDHRKYVLVPRLRSEHSRKTATEDNKRDYKGRFVKKK